MFEWINDNIWLFFILVIVFLGILARRYKQYCHKNNLHVPWFISMLSGRGRGGHHGFPGGGDGGGGGGGDGGGGGE